VASEQKFNLREGTGMSIQEPLDELFFKEPAKNWKELLEQVPDTIFYKDNGKPNYNKIFVALVQELYQKGSEQVTITTDDFLNGKLPNLSTFQRSVSKERARRQN
jgi:hypothetical protein